LTKFLKLAITELLKQFGTSIIEEKYLLEQLHVTGILIKDSSYFARWDGSKDNFSGVGTWCKTSYLF